MLGEQRQQRLAGNGPAHGRRREQQRRGGRADPQEPRHGPRPGGLGGPQQGRRPFGCGSRQHPTWHGAAPCPPPSETPLRAGSRRRLRHRPAERHRPRREERGGTATRSFGAVRRKPRRGGSGQLRGGEDGPHSEPEARFPLHESAEGLFDTKPRKTYPRFWL